MSKRSQLAQELVVQFEYLCCTIGQAKALGDQRLQAARRRYNEKCFRWAA